MKWRSHPYLTFLASAAVACLGIETVVEFLARAIVKSGGWANDLAMSAYVALRLLPFTIVYYVLLGLICGSLARKASFKKGAILFALGALMLGGLGFWCAFASQHALLNHAWTASALVYLGLLVYGVPVLLACLVIRWLTGSRTAKETIET